MAKKIITIKDENLHAKFNEIKAREKLSNADKTLKLLISKYEGDDKTND